MRLIVLLRYAMRTSDLLMVLMLDPDQAARRFEQHCTALLTTFNPVLEQLGFTPVGV